MEAEEDSQELVNHCDLADSQKGGHRGISLLSVPSKIYSRILETRIRTIVDSQIGEEQYGFRT